MCSVDLVQERQGGGSWAPGCFEDKRSDSGRGGSGDTTCVMGPLADFFGLRGAIGVAVGGGWVFRVFIGSSVDYRYRRWCRIN